MRLINIYLVSPGEGMVYIIIIQHGIFKLLEILHIAHVCIKLGIHDASFASKSPFKFFDRVYHTRNLNQKTWTNLDGIEMHPIFFQLGWNLDGDWPIRRQNPYQHQFVNVNNNNYRCCAKMAGKRGNSKMKEKDSYKD